MKAPIWTAVLAITLSLCSPICYAQEMTKEDIIKELNLLKEKIGKLEEALETMEKNEPSQEEFAEEGRILKGTEGELPEGQEAPGRKVEKADPGKAEDVGFLEELSDDDSILHTGERGIRSRLEALEKPLEGIDLSGAVEIEAFYEREEPKEGHKEEESDLRLETVELAVDAAITDEMRAHILFDFEEGEGVDIDEAIIHFRATEVCVPDRSCDSFWYANIGRMVVPFGYFETHFISDPITQELGETKETALVIGGYRAFLNLAGGVFNGDVNESRKEDHLDDFVGVCFLTLPEHINPDLHLMGGVSYITNIANSDMLKEYINDEFESETVEDRVQAAAAFLSASFKERFFLEAEWIGALETFKEDRDFKPEAWNLEFAFRPIEPLEFALRYGGSENSLHFLPETQFGFATIYEIFENTSLSLEYRFDEYENNDKVETITTQLAIEFD